MGPDSPPPRRPLHDTSGSSERPPFTLSPEPWGASHVPQPDTTVYASADAALVGGGLYGRLLDAIILLATDPAPCVSALGCAALRMAGVELAPMTSPSCKQPCLLCCSERGSPTSPGCRAALSRRPDFVLWKSCKGLSGAYFRSV